MPVARLQQALRVDPDRVGRRDLRWEQLGLGRVGHRPTIAGRPETGQVWVRTRRTRVDYVLVDNPGVMSGGLESEGHLGPTGGDYSLTTDLDRG